jgi:hypothetical protein
MHLYYPDGETPPPEVVMLAVVELDEVEVLVEIVVVVGPRVAGIEKLDVTSVNENVNV